MTRRPRDVRALHVQDNRDRLLGFTWGHLVVQNTERYLGTYRLEFRPTKAEQHCLIPVFDLVLAYEQYKDHITRILLCNDTALRSRSYSFNKVLVHISRHVPVTLPPVNDLRGPYCAVDVTLQEKPWAKRYPDVKSNAEAVRLFMKEQRHDFNREIDRAWAKAKSGARPGLL